MAAHVLRRLCRISSGVALPQLRRVVVARGLATSEETTDPAEETQSSEAPRYTELLPRSWLCMYAHKPSVIGFKETLILGFPLLRFPKE